MTATKVYVLSEEWERRRLLMDGFDENGRHKYKSVSLIPFSTKREILEELTLPVTEEYLETFPHHLMDIEVEIEAEYSFTPGRMYMSNGDPGYPDESEFEVIGVEETFCIGEDCFSNSQVCSAFSEWAEENADEGDFNFDD